MPDKILSTGPLGRSFADRANRSYLLHVEVVNESKNKECVKLIVKNLDTSPISILHTDDQTIQSNKFHNFDFTLGPEIIHWMVELETDSDKIYATVYHFHSDDFIADQRLTYKHTQLIKKKKK